MKSIQQQWTKYQKTVVPKNASANQVLQLRDAYFAGFFSMLLSVKALIDLPEDEAAEALQRFNTEMLSFILRVKEAGDKEQ